MSNGEYWLHTVTAPREMKMNDHALILINSFLSMYIVISDYYVMKG